MDGLLGCLIYAALGALGAFVLYGLHPIARWRFRHFPGPSPRWLLGNLPEVLREGQEAATARWCTEYGPGPFVYWLGGVPVVTSDHPQFAKKALVSAQRQTTWSLHLGKEARFEQEMLVFANGPLWKVARNAWQPFFKQEVLNKSGPLMGSSASCLCDRLAAAADSRAEVDVWRALGQMTLDVVGSCSFGIDFRALEHGGSRRLDSVHTTADHLVDALQTYFDLFGLGTPLYALFYIVPEFKAGVSWLANVLPNRAFRQEAAARRELRKVSTELVQLARASPSGTDPSTTNRRPAVVDSGSFLSLLLPCIGTNVGSTVLDDLWAGNQATGFILAGYETTANALAYTVFLLACNPDKEAALVAEVEAWGVERPPRPEDLPAFPYARAVLQESLRLYPPAPRISRILACSTVLGGKYIPAGTMVQVPVYSMHRSERYWRDPLAFLPERWLAGNPSATEVDQDAFMPFGHGARKCIGYRFAEMEAMTALVALYQQFTFRLLPGQLPLKVETRLTMAPAHGIRVTVHRRR